MGYAAKKKNKKKKGSPVAKVAIFLALLVGLIVAAKQTSVLSLLGLATETAETKPRKASHTEKPPSEPVISEFERKQAEARERAKQLEAQKAAQERAHQEELARKQIEEKAFRTWYKPSPECVNASGKWDVSVKCGNEYMEAKRRFIEQKLNQ